MAEFFKIYFNQKINLNLAKCRCRWNENAREIHSLWLYSNRRNLISTNLTFLFIGHWEQTMNFHCLKKIEWVATLLPSVIRSSYCFEMVARIMWLYKTSNIAQVRTSYKFLPRRDCRPSKPDNSKIFAAVLLIGKRSPDHDHSALNPCSL